MHSNDMRSMANIEPPPIPPLQSELTDTLLRALEMTLIVISHHLALPDHVVLGAEDGDAEAVCSVWGGISYILFLGARQR